MASTIEPQLTIADLDLYPDDDGNRYELIGGRLFVSRAPGIPHQRIILNLEVALSLYLRAHPIGILVPGAGAIFSDYDAVIPDLAFVRNERWQEVVTGEKFTGPVDLAIEVTSPGAANHQRDLIAKRALYARYGVEEYWVVDTENLSVVVFRLWESSFKEISTLRDGDKLRSSILPSFELQVDTIFQL